MLINGQSEIPEEEYKAVYAVIIWSTHKNIKGTRISFSLNYGMKIRCIIFNMKNQGLCIDLVCRKIRCDLTKSLSILLQQMLGCATYSWEYPKNNYINETIKRNL